MISFTHIDTQSIPTVSCLSITNANFSFVPTPSVPLTSTGFVMPVISNSNRHRSHRYHHYPCRTWSLLCSFISSTALYPCCNIYTCCFIAFTMAFHSFSSRFVLIFLYEITYFAYFSSSALFFARTFHLLLFLHCPAFLPEPHPPQPESGLPEALHFPHRQWLRLQQEVPPASVRWKAEHPIHPMWRI